MVFAMLLEHKLLHAPRLLSTEPIVDEVLLATLESSCNGWNPETGDRGG